MPRKKINIKDKKKFLDFVYLSDEEHASLCELLGNEKTDHWIEELNGALGQHGYKYASHYWTIRNWAKLDIAKRRGKDEAQRAADSVIELLKVRGSYMPEDPKIRAALHKMLIAAKMVWPQLKVVLLHPDGEAKIREQFLKMYGASS
jgi:hypothetical protein